MSTDVAVVHAVTDELVSAFRRLLPQLSPSARSDAQTLGEVLASPGNRVLIARVDGQIMGTLTLVTFPIPTGVRAWIEDVVVDEHARGRGIGVTLMTEAIQLARADGARTIELTSHPTRTAANRLYQKLGFQLRETNLYRLTASE